MRNPDAPQKRTRSNVRTNLRNLGAEARRRRQQAEEAAQELARLLLPRTTMKGST